MTMNKAFTPFVLALLIIGCSSNQEPACEDIVEVNRQQQECQRLKDIMNSKGYPQRSSEARKRFEEECINFRFYRDTFEDTICTAHEKKELERKEQ